MLLGWCFRMVIIWRAKSFGAKGTQIGEVVFNTSLRGYQEILTDPSYAGQFVLMINPHIGNTGVNFGDEESSECFLGGLVIRSLSIGDSNPDEVLFSSGPRDPSYAVKTVKELLGKVPPYLEYVWDISCLDKHWNHNYAVDPAILPKGVEVTHINLNDGTCAGLAFPAMKIMCLQYHPEPEASPGPHDSDSVFTEFTELMKP
ncbi:hypothetical protein QQ045_011095 [Rhodiola kirilowii]